MSDIINYEQGQLLPDLNDDENVQLAKYDLTVEYWTPESEGETKRLFFKEIQDMVNPSTRDGEIEKEVPNAIFIEHTPEGYRTIRNASKRLVAALVNWNVQPYTALEITYMGKERNKTNQYMSDRWSVRPLIIKKNNAQQPGSDRLQ